MTKSFCIVTFNLENLDDTNSAEFQKRSFSLPAGAGEERVIQTYKH